MRRFFWSFISAISGFLVGMAIFDMIYRSLSSVSIFILVIGIIMMLISIWGYKKYVGKRFTV
ncbi:MULTISPECIES: hypothetical protein [unclassified Lysinibacillus]|uniref:hypothetical protein n=1 Tax=unclassified Lysinibacillus TaxID=2636778 RepID=UPI002010F915|nr:MULTISPECIES: hypothetical protein [unclassified Lysinibacillus]MCL1696716.1 hypothetical protein [Lysinibacillus sp. BPa_S21]MCL1698798.1 hypothetical protein [Lysinibacillus sp. Bpr_S20]